MELLRMDSAIDELITRNASLGELSAHALAQGSLPLPKTACAGCWRVTSIEEVGRVVDLTVRLAGWGLTAKVTRARPSRRTTRRVCVRTLRRAVSLASSSQARHAHGPIPLPRHQRCRRGRQGRHHRAARCRSAGAAAGVGLSLIRASKLRSRSRRLASLPTRELINMLFHMQMLLRAGVPIITALLQDLRDGADSLELRQVAASLMDRIQNGSTLADAMAADPGIFSRSWCTWCARVKSPPAGRGDGRTGAIAEVAGRAGSTDQETAHVSGLCHRHHHRGGGVPDGLPGAPAGQLHPQHGPGNPVSDAPADLAVRGLCQLLVDHSAGPVVAVMALAAAARANEQVRFKLHQALLSIPALGPVIKKIILARLTDSFGLMYRTGIPVIESLGYCEKITSNLPVRAALVRARERIANGASISDAFAMENLFPSLVVRMLRVGRPRVRWTMPWPMSAIFHPRHR